MDDEMTTTTPEEEVPEVEDEAVIEAPAAPDPDEIARKAEELAKKERDLQRGFDEIARRERELAAKPPAPVEDIPEFDEATQKALDAYIQQCISPLSAMTEQVYLDMATAELERVAKEQGVSADELKEVLRDNPGLAPMQATVQETRRSFEKAAKLHKASSFDEAKMKEHLKAEVLKELEAEGVRVESVRPARAETAISDSRDYEEITDSDTRYQFVLKQLGLKK